jgi:low affinity Fe/Cu permease
MAAANANAKPVNGKEKRSSVKARANTSAWFDHLARGIAWVSGRPVTFLISVALIIVWLISGPFFKFSDTWQLVINTGTTIITFLMVFLIQNTQNRDTAAVHLKLDELIRAIEGARNTAMLLEDASEDELVKVRDEYVELAEQAKEKLGERGVDVPRSPECDEQQAAKPR